MALYRSVLAISLALAACGKPAPAEEPDRVPASMVASPSAKPKAIVSDPVASPDIAVPSQGAPAIELKVPVAATSEPAIPSGDAASQNPPATPTPAAPGANALVRYAPRDGCKALPGFPAFREKLTAAIRRRDAAALAALAEPVIKLDFGGGTWREELIKRLGAGPTLWNKLDALLPLGCAADGGLATMPWIFARVPEAVDPYSAQLVVGEGVALLEKPAEAATVVRVLDWALVTSDKAVSPEKPAFVPVTTSAGQRGFVAATKLRSLLDYRLIVDRTDGEWRISAFVAGD